MFEQSFCQQGWECPKCGRVYSPSTSMCRFCGGEANLSANNHLVMGFLSDDETEGYNTDEDIKATSNYVSE